MAVAVGFADASVQATVISVNYSSTDTATQILPTETAGFIPQTNWNNLISGTTASGILDDLGNSTALSVTFSGQDFLNSASTTSADQKLFNFQKFNASPEVSISNIPYAKYDLYYYVQDSFNPGGIEFEAIITAGAFSETYFFNTEVLPFIDTGYVITTNTVDTLADPFANTVFVSGLTSPTLTIDSGRIPPSVFHGGAVGFQIVQVPTEVPEPGTLALLGIGLGGLALARRRKKAA